MGAGSSGGMREMWRWRWLAQVAGRPVARGGGKWVGLMWSSDALLSSPGCATDVVPPLWGEGGGSARQRAAGSAVFNTGEAANARMPGEKRNAFGIARKETAEPPRSRVRTRASTRRASRSTLDVRERWKGLDACSRGLRVSSTPRCPRPVHCRYACAFSTGCCR